MRKRKADIVPITASTLARAVRGERSGEDDDADTDTVIPTPPTVESSSQSTSTAATTAAISTSCVPSSKAVAAAIGVPVGRSSHVRSAQLVRYFSCLDAVVYSLQRRSAEAIWKLVQRGVDQMMSSSSSSSPRVVSSSSSTFTLDDLALIMSIFSGAFSLDWKYVAANSLEPLEYHLCISINTNTTSAGNGGEEVSPPPPPVAAGMALLTRDMKTETRIERFRELLNDYITRHNGNNDSVSSTMPLPVSTGIVPVKPVVTIYSVSESKRAAATATKFTKIVQERQFQSSQELLSQSSRGVDGMEQLRLLAAERGRKHAEQSASTAAAKALTERKGQLKSLPAIADSLRSIVRLRNRMSHPLQDILSSLAPQLRFSKQALLSRLVLLTDAAPEFLSLFPANDIVPVATLKINMDAPYGAVRSKLSKL